MNRFPWRNTLIFLLIVAAHMLFKLIALDASGFWYDETFGLYYSEQDWGLIKHTSEWDVNPPLYYYFLYIWRNLFGIREYAIRFSSVLFSSLSAGVLYFLVRKHFNQTAAVLSLIFFTASYEVYYYAHEARCYSIILFLVLSSTWCFFNLIERKGAADIILLGICNFFLVYAHYVAAIVPAIQFFLLLVFFEKDFFKRAGLSFLLTFALVFWRFTKKQVILIFHHEKSFWLTKPNSGDLKHVFYDFFNGTFFFWISVAVAAIALGLIIIYNRKIFSDRAFRIKSIYLLLCGVCTIFLFYVLSQFMPMFLKRYLLFTTPFLYMLIAVLVSLTGNQIRFALAGALCLVSALSFIHFDYRTPKPMNYREAAQTVKYLKTNETLVLAETRDIKALFAYYFDQPAFSDFRKMDSLLNTKNVYFVTKPEDIAYVDLKKYKQVILTQTFERFNEDNTRLLNYISSQFKFKASNSSFADVRINLFTTWPEGSEELAKIRKKKFGSLAPLKKKKMKKAISRRS
jgi:uncharacterized membrane protein